ncbi:MAG: glutaminyl-peptide cyclotransferase [Bacteroidota bacterium]|nr:glutaminyl-peptide cyclotransferase [Bacteroidota bacterium]
MKFLLIIFTAFLCFSCNNSVNPLDSERKNQKAAVPFVNWVYIKSHYHDTTSFTEGFLFYKGELYESTGSPKDLPQTKSLLGLVDLNTGKIDVKVELDRKLFGEGIAVLNEKIFWLTYKTKTGLVYDLKTYEKIEEFILPTKEGWGLTTDGKSLIMSDGTNKLTYLDPETFDVIKEISVKENNYEKDNLNELEFINGYIYANVWTTRTIVKIDPESAQVVGILDLSALVEEANDSYQNSLEMNGIAYDSVSNSVFITGKLWPNIFEIKLEDN